MRSLRPWPLPAHTGPLPRDREPTPHDELREGPRPGSPAHAGSAPTRMLELTAATPAYDQRGAVAGWLRRGDVVPAAKGIGPAGTVVHVITDGPLAGRIIYRHRPGVLGSPGRSAVSGGEGPA